MDYSKFNAHWGKWKKQSGLGSVSDELVLVADPEVFGGLCIAQRRTYGDSGLDVTTGIRLNREEVQDLFNKLDWFVKNTSKVEQINIDDCETDEEIEQKMLESWHKRMLVVEE